ncbi:MAG: hypothetical protein KFB95_00955 [Simkaniaceae bacterium]|nr:MAG: hypothetical protein KFB95_00955 [Simkaniaceae bacterium]
MQIDPHAFSAKAGEFVGEMFAFGGLGKVIRVAEGISVLGMACEGGMVGLVVSEAHDTNKAAGVVFGFIGGAAFGRLSSRAQNPLADRVFIRPQGYSKELRFLRSVNQPAYRSGFVSDKTALKLAEREVRVIKPMELPYLQKGKDLKWFAENSPKIDHLGRIARNDKEFHKLVVREFAPQGLNELQLRRTLDYAGFNTYAIPEGLPGNMVVEFSKKNGGMSYRLLGSTNKQNLVVRVCPGLAKESVVSSVIKGNHLNGQLPGTLRQQYPYVVQTKGHLKLRADGTWTDIAKDPATHLRLETYVFKGWE